LDPGVSRTDAESGAGLGASPPSATDRLAPGKAASEPAARVGDDIITLNELRAAVREQIRSMNLPQGQTLQAKELNALASLMLDRMIDRSLLIQEAKRTFKDEKKWQAFLDAIERGWKEKEIPELVRQYQATDALNLEQALSARGLSLSEKHQAFVQNTLSREFLAMRIRDKIRVFPSEMREYYEAHRAEYHRNAQVRWREVAIEAARYPDRAQARARAEAALARIRRGEPFEEVARTASEGPTASQGGLWETTPDGFAVPAVNQALVSQPVGRPTGILEGPDGYHIILVESRRQAGPARFDEVQDEIRKVLMERKEAQEMNALLDELRGRHSITTMFDGTESAPGVARAAMTRATGSGRR
jgi:parvulin-like peptidyl-prolyl isomerase